MSSKKDYPTITRKERKHLVATFKLFATRNTRLYFQVHVWDTKKTFKEHTGHKKAAGNCAGYTVLNFDKGKQTTSLILGEINLIKNRLWTEILAHELCHAAFRYCSRKKIDVNDSSDGDESSMHEDCGEERYCYAQGYMVHCLVNKLHKLKLL